MHLADTSILVFRNKYSRPSIHGSPNSIGPYEVRIAKRNEIEKIPD
jgi:hypothetical protein